jgi:fructose-1,6-bisphosphatase II / sedoheptulose-1,7-bisphosphatase
MAYTNDILINRAEGIATEVVAMSAISCFDFIGKKDNHGADSAAVQMARLILNNQLIDGTIRIGEGERDDAPMLYTGERVGNGSEKLDIAIDPLEGTSLCSNNEPGAITTMAISRDGSIMNAPDIYMDKIATCKAISPNSISLDYTTEQNLTNLAKELNKKPGELRVCMLNRERNQEKINVAKAMGVHLTLLGDGDISAIMKTHTISDDFDIYMGIGGAPEGIISAACVNATSGFMEGRFMALNDRQKMRARALQTNLQAKYTSNQLVSKDAIFAAAAVTTSVINGTHGLQKEDGKFKVSIILANTALKEVKIIQKYLSPQIAIKTEMPLKQSRPASA